MMADGVEKEEEIGVRGDLGRGMKAEAKGEAGTLKGKPVT